MLHHKTLSVLTFPIVLTIGIILIPVVPDYSDHFLAAEAVLKTGRWVAGHLIAAVAFGFSILAASTIVDELRHRSAKVPGVLLPFFAIGAGLYAAGLGADGIGPVAVLPSSVSPTLYFDGSGWWLSGVFMAATGFYALGLISLVIHVIRVELIIGLWRYMVFISALVFVSAPAIPSGWALYGEALAALGVFAPIGLSIGHRGSR
jgi:hypothetical protein